MPTWQIKRSYTFEAAHYIPNYSTSQLCHTHGHSWTLYAVFQVTQLGDGIHAGLALPYEDIDVYVNAILKGVLHGYLNPVSTPIASNPTAEVIAQWVYQQLKTIFPPTLLSVTVGGNCAGEVTYSE